MTTPPFVRRDFNPGVAALDFSLPLPPDWLVHPLPADDAGFDDPTRLLALAAVTAPHAAIVLAVAARPAYGDGCLADWAHYLLQHHGLQPRALGEGRLGDLPAIVGEAMQPSELGPLVVRFAFAEDGGRLLNVTLTAPEMLAGAVHPVWSEACCGFTLREPRGATVPPYPPAPAVGNHEPLAGGVMTAFALADDAASFDPEHPINASLRARGEGFAPPVVEVDAAARCALLASSALQAQLAVPFGWHPLDDGRRLRLLDPAGHVQVSLNLLAAEGRSAPQVLDEIEAQLRADYPAPECLRLEQGPLHALGVRNIADGQQPLEQFHLITRGPADGLPLRARVTATPEHAVQAANLGEALLAHVRYPVGA